MSKKSQLQLGDVVSLRSGGIPMTVSHVDKDTGRVHCQYFNSQEVIVLSPSLEPECLKPLVDDEDDEIVDV